MTDTATLSPPLRRASDDPTLAQRRIGVLWCADATTEEDQMLGTVLDISPGGAKLKVDREVLGQVERFRLAVETLAPIDCVPVWQHDDRLGVRFLDSQPSMIELQDLLEHPPYLQDAAG